MSIMIGLSDKDIPKGKIPAAGCPGNNFITERFCWKEASKAAWVSEAPDIGDIGPSGPPAIGHLNNELLETMFAILRVKNILPCVFS